VLRQQLVGMQCVQGQQAEDFRTRGDRHRDVGLVIVVPIRGKS
jgi:hypothetical protein